MSEHIDLTEAAVADLLGCTRAHVGYARVKLGFPARTSPKPVVEVGDVYAMLTVIAEAGQRGKRGVRLYLCRCECGNEVVKPGSDLRRGIKSCGCLWFTTRRTHGQTGTAAYTTWSAMRQRCFNPNNQDYRYYGARGITICDRWHDFENFYEDMGDRPEWATGGIDRIDVNGNYTPGNAEWVTIEQQAANKRPPVYSFPARRPLIRLSGKHHQPR